MLKKDIGLLAHSILTIIGSTINVIVGNVFNHALFTKIPNIENELKYLYKPRKILRKVVTDMICGLAIISHYLHVSQPTKSVCRA